MKKRLWEYRASIFYFGLIFALKPLVGIISINLAWLLSNVIVAILSLILTIRNGKLKDILDNKEKEKQSNEADFKQLPF